MKRVILSVALFFGASFGSAVSAQTIPAGTPINVRTIDSISVKTASPGASFRGTLADPVMINGRVLIPRGAPVQLTTVNVQKAGRIEGRDRITLRVSSITFNGRTLPVASTVAEQRGSRRGRRTLKGTGIGAGAGGVIGAIAGGGTGLAVGALVGGGGGTAIAAATGKRNLTIPPETVLAFKLQSPLRVR
jgi:hypothetical protein